MYTERFDFSIRLELLSDLHVGAGENVPLSQLRPKTKLRRKEGDREASDPGVATIVRDKDKAPWIPPTTIKGMLAGLVEDAQQDGMLFGRLPDPTANLGGVAGRLIQWGGALVAESRRNALTLPFWSDDTQSFIGTHVGIDRTTGAADPGRLFFREYLPAGLQFSVDFCWQDTRATLDAMVLPLLERLARADGVPIGAASGAGFGRVRAIDGVVAGRHRRMTVTASGIPGVEDRSFERRLAVAEAPPRLMLTLHCDGPFLIADPQRGGEDERSTLHAYGRATEPELLGTSLLGVMRSRASWLQQTRMGLPPDDPSALYKPGVTLTPCQRLFGVSGWAKLLRIADITTSRCGSPRHRYPGIALDDFTQGALAGRLFTIEAPGDIGFTVALETGTPRRPLSAEDSALLEQLIDDARTYGWGIGHSTGTGFGWFTVDTAPARPFEEAMVHD